MQVACPRLSIDWGMEFSKVIVVSYSRVVYSANDLVVCMLVCFNIVAVVVVV